MKRTLSLAMAALFVGAIILSNWKGGDWSFWLVIAFVVFGGFMPAKNWHLRRRARVSDTAGVRHGSLTGDAPVLAVRESTSSKDLARSIGLGG